MLIRAALWLSVLAFGVVVWVLHRTGTLPIQAEPMALRYAGVALAVGAVVVAFRMRGSVQQLPEGIRNMQTLLFWGVGEAAALFGGVVFLFTNEAQWYGLGLLSMLTTFVLLPINRST